MSQPARPTRANRKAVLLRAVPWRRSLAIARIAPAPAQTLHSTAATMGCGQWRITRLDQVASVMRVNISSSRRGQGYQRADDLVHVAARAEVVARAGDDDGAHVVRMAQRDEQVAQLGALSRSSADSCAPGRFSVHARDAVAAVPQEVLRLVAGERAAVACGKCRVEDQVASRVMVAVTLISVSCRPCSRQRQRQRRRWPSNACNCSPSSAFRPSSSSITQRSCSAATRSNARFAAQRQRDAGTSAGLPGRRCA